MSAKKKPFLLIFMKLTIGIIIFTFYRLVQLCETAENDTAYPQDRYCGQGPVLTNVSLF